MNLELRWYGPYSVIEGATMPYFFAAKSEIIDRPGVYLWTIPFDNEELVLYVGKTVESFSKRLWTEFRRRRGTAWNWIADPAVRKSRISRPDCWDWIPDPEQLQRGVKKWLYEPYGWMKPNLESWIEHESHFHSCWLRFLQIVRIFVAPITGTRREVRDTETALMWAVWDHEDANRPSGVGRYFLTNGTPVPKRLPYRYSISINAPVRFRGLGEAVSG